jgi:myo-inositol-1(or 4)-monophosphatase
MTSSYSAYSGILQRIENALEAARVIFNGFTPGEVQAEYKAGHDPVTAADKAVDAALRRNLLGDGEGWLSEESADDLSRLDKRHVWVVDPLDGTREFVQGLPEFCVSIGFVEDGKPVAGGIYNPATQETFLGAIDSGVTYNGKASRPVAPRTLEGALILASRSEVKRGEWETFRNAPFQLRPMGSVAYKLALVAAGLAQATFTLTPKHEWDVAAGVALVLSSGGVVRTLENTALKCNQRNPLLSGLIASRPEVSEDLLRYLESYLKPTPAH